MAKALKLKGKKLLVILGVLLLLSLCGFSIAFFLNLPREIVFEDFKEVQNEMVNASGGEIVVDGSSMIDGLKIEVPQEAYSKDLGFKISEAAIVSHSYGDDFTPITPLIKVENGGAFAEYPMIVTIPIEIDDDEFAMGFYYDELTGELEGIPFLELNQDSIVLLTNHFSNIVVSKVKTGRIVDSIDTGFKVKRNNIQTPNYGTYLTYGHCAGQAIAEMIFFQNKDRIGWDRPLHGLFDNNGDFETPDLWQDDALVLRLSAVLHDKYSKNWSAGGEALYSYHKDLGKNDEKTYYAFAYAMQITKNPQFVYIGSDGGGHALVAYKVVKNEIFVADPNNPDDFDRKIVFQRSAEGDAKFAPYYSGANAQQASEGDVAYDKIGYYGVHALIERDFVVDLWNKVKIGEDVGTNLFPSDANIQIVKEKDEEGNFVLASLADGIRPKMEGSLFARLTDPKPDEQISIYHGRTFVGFLDDDWIEVKLSQGDNSIGIYHEKKRWGDFYSFVNFVRYNVINFDESFEEEIEQKTIDSKSEFDYKDLKGPWLFKGNMLEYDLSGGREQPPLQKPEFGGIFNVNGEQVTFSYFGSEEIVVPVVISGDNISFDISEPNGVFSFKGKVENFEGDLRIVGGGFQEINDRYGYLHATYEWVVERYEE
jgi:hypothetical protein